MANGERPQAQVVAQGLHGRIEFAVRDNGAKEAEDFLRSPGCRPYVTGLATRFQAIVDNGDIDGVRPKFLRDGIHEIIKGQARIFCFKDGDSWRLTNGALKRGNKAQDRDIDRAVTITREDRARREPKPKKKRP